MASSVYTWSRIVSIIHNSCRLSMVCCCNNLRLQHSIVLFILIELSCRMMGSIARQYGDDQPWRFGRNEKRGSSRKLLHILDQGLVNLFFLGEMQVQDYVQTV